MKTTGLALVALAGLAMPAHAQTQAPGNWNPSSPEKRQILPSFTVASVEAVLDSIGAKHMRAPPNPSRPTLLVTFANNRKALVVLSACDSGSACKALSIQSFWTKIAHSPPEKTRAAIEAFNDRYAFSKAFVAPDGRPALQRYLTADYGFVRGNLAVNFLVFAEQAERFAIDVLRPLETVEK